MLPLSPMYAFFSGNAAFRKPASMTGQFGSLSSDKGVDGILATPNQAFCAHPKKWRVPARFMVDLGGTYFVEEVILFNTANDGGELIIYIA